MLKLLARGLLAVLLLAAPAAYADDISNGSWSTTDGSNTAAPPNGWPAGMFPNQVEPSARAGMGGVKRWWERANAALSTTGSAGAYAITPSNTSYPTAYTQGEIYCAKANFASVGNDTLNVNGLGAKALYNNLARIGAGSLATGQQFCASYDGSLNSGAGGFQVISGIPIAQTLSTRQVLTSGASATYTTPAGARQLRIRMVGGGGGGGSYNAAGNGSDGGDTGFNSIIAKHGSGGLQGGSSSIGNGGAGGTGGAGSASLRMSGQTGVSGGFSIGAIQFNNGNPGGSSCLGAGSTTVSVAAAANSGGGGAGGASSSATIGGGGGGGAGECVELIVNSPSSTYTYTIGAGGNGASASNGGSGVIIVDEYY